MRVSMSNVNDVDVRGGVVEGQGAGGAEGQVAEVWSDQLVVAPLRTCCIA